MKKIILTIAGLLFLGFGAVHSGSQDMQEFVLFGGSNTDSLEQASAWIPIRGAHRVVIRTYSLKAAFHASTDADSTFSDSLTAFNVLLSDSICCYVTGPEGFTIASAADSFVVPVTAIGDTIIKGVGVWPYPINRQLRAPSNGSGIYTYVYPTGSGLVTKEGTDNVIGAQYMRVRVTPLRRMTVTGSQSTAGKRVNGLKQFRMVAYVYKGNR